MRIGNHGAITSAKLTAAALERVEADNPRLNAVVTLLADEAMRDAEAADAESRAGNSRGPLHGMPFGVKDIVDTAGVRTTAGSAFFRDRVPDEDAEVVRRVRDAGAVVIGKLHTHEFAFGPAGDASCFGPVRNPYDPERMAGGPAAARPSRWPPACVPPRSAATPVARSAYPRLCAVWWA